MKNLHMISFILVVVGALNWGLVGAMNINLVEMIFGQYPMVVQIVYVAVGLSGLYQFFTHKGDCKVCMSKKK